MGPDRKTFTVNGTSTFLNPQEASHFPQNKKLERKKRLPFCVYDLFFNLPHPAAPAEVSDRAQIIDPPVILCPLLNEEMCNPDNVTRLSRFAFPEHDESSLKEQEETTTNETINFSRGRTIGANLTKHDVYLVDFVVHHHTFSILLSDGKTRVHGHVRRYLPPHSDALSRTDVGRRRPRAMVLLTRTIGGERFYASVLK